MYGAVTKISRLYKIAYKVSSQLFWFRGLTTRPHLCDVQQNVSCVATVLLRTGLLSCLSMNDN